MILYGAETCTSCKILRKKLEKENISYTYVDVSKIPGFTGILPQLHHNSNVYTAGKIYTFLKEYKENVFTEKNNAAYKTS